MGEGNLQPRPCSDPMEQIPKAAHEPWWRGRILVCWLVFQALFAASWLIFHVAAPDAWLRFLGCFIGSFLSAPLLVYLTERLFRADLRV